MDYDPTYFMNITTTRDAMHVILHPTATLTTEQRWQAETPALTALMKRFIMPSSLVLDYGCGIGRLAKPLIEDCGCTVVGIDISPKMRTMATSYIPDPRFVAMSPEMLDKLVTPEFDATIAVWSLQHCLDLEASIWRIRRSLLPEGRLLVVNNVRRCLPVEGGRWIDDGKDVAAIIETSRFEQIERGELDEIVAPGLTFWAAYKRL